MPADMRAERPRFQHVAIIVSDMDAAYARLREHGVEHASTGPQRLPDWNPTPAGSGVLLPRSRRAFPGDPRFPPGKGGEVAAAATALFLGIDHTAIVVDDTDASLALLSRRARAAGRGRERELRRRAGAPEQRVRRPAAHHRAARERRARHRAARVSRAARRPAGAARSAGERRRALADHDDRHGTGAASAGRRHAAIHARVAGVSRRRVVVQASASRGCSARDPDGHGVRLVGETCGAATASNR